MADLEYEFVKKMRKDIGLFVDSDHEDVVRYTVMECIRIASQTDPKTAKVLADSFGIKQKNSF
jgi:hypothetical protein